MASSQSLAGQHSSISADSSVSLARYLSYVIFNSSFVRASKIVVVFLREFLCCLLFSDAALEGFCCCLVVALDKMAYALRSTIVDAVKNQRLHTDTITVLDSIRIRNFLSQQYGLLTKFKSLTQNALTAS
jgi:hypothetical protein